MAIEQLIALPGGQLETGARKWRTYAYVKAETSLVLVSGLSDHSLRGRERRCGEEK